MTEIAPTTVVVPEHGSRLEQLHAHWVSAKATADAAAAELRDINDAIKAELATAAPGQTRVELRSTGGPALGLTYVEAFRIDTKRLKAEDPETYVRYGKTTGSWRLAQVRQAGA